MDRFHDAAHNLTEVQVVRVDDHGVTSRFERRDRALPVDSVPGLDLSAPCLLVNGFSQAFELRVSPPLLLVQARRLPTASWPDAKPQWIVTITSERGRSRAAARRPRPPTALASRLS